VTTAAEATFRATIFAAGKTATGMVVPPAVVEALGSGKRPPVRVTINGQTFRNTVAVMGGEFMIGVSAANRKLTGVEAGDEVDVHLELDTAPRVVELPVDFAAALDADPVARAFFDGLSNSVKGWHVSSIEGAKTAETRTRRIDKSVAMLHDHRPR
jgi:hypothetical protein